MGWYRIISRYVLVSSLVETIITIATNIGVTKIDIKRSTRSDLQISVR